MPKSKVKEKKFNATEEWNVFVKNLMSAEKAWEKLRDYFSGKDRSEEWPAGIVRICKTTQFRYAIEDFIHLCGVRGNIEDHFIETKKEGD